MNKLWNSLQNTIQFIFELRIAVEKDYFNLSSEQQKLFYSLSYIQTLSIFLSSLQNSTYQSQIIETQKNISFITRPYEYLQGGLDLEKYYFLVPLIYYTILIISIVFLKSQYNLTQLKIISFIQNLNSIIKNYFLFQIFLKMAFQQLLFIFFLELSLISFYSSQSNVTDLFIAGFSMIQSVLTIIIQIYLIKFDNPALFELNLGKFNRSSTDYLQAIIITLVVITKKSELQNQIQIIGFLLLIIYVIKLKDIYLNYDKYYDLQRFELSILSYCFCFVFTMTIANLRSRSQFEFQTLIIIYIFTFPLINYLSVQIIDEIFMNIFKEQENIIIQNYKLWTINQSMLLNKEQQSKLALILIYINFTQNKIDDSQKFKYQEVIYSYYVQEIQIFYQIISQTKDQNRKLEYYLQYLKFNFNRYVYEVQNQIKLKASINSTRRSLDDSKSIDKVCVVNKFINFNKLSLQENLRLAIMKQNTKNRFLQTSNYDQDEMKKVISLFIKFEQSNHKILENIQSAVKHKLEFMHECLQRNNQLFEKPHQIVDKLHKIEINFIDQYQCFPSKKMQTYLMFYFAEIQNDFLSAYKYQNVNTMTDENLIKMQMNKSYDILKENIEYITLSLDEMTNTFDIAQYSKNLMDTIMIKNQQKIPLKLDDILPTGFQQIHTEYIERFLIHGKSKFFRQFSQAFYINKDQYMNQIDAIFDILDYLNKPSYIVFLRPQPNNSPHIWVDQNMNIVAITKDVNELFSIQENYQQIFREKVHFKTIKWLIPKFDQLINETKSSNMSALQKEIKLNQFFISNDKDQYQYYCDLIINIRQSPSNIKYYIIQIFNCKAVEITLQDNSIINEEPIVYEQLEQLKTQRQMYYGLQMFDTQFNSPKSEKKLSQNTLNTQRELFLMNQEIIQSECKQLDRLNPQLQSHEIKLSSQITIPQQKYSKEQHLEAFAIQSQASSIAGIRQSRYYKRYEIIHKFMSSNQPQQETKIQFILLSLILVVGAIQAIIFLGQINNQIQTLQQYIDVLSLKSTFSSAQDSYYICMASIIYHSLQLINQVITPQSYQLELKYSSFRLGNIFDELKQNNKEIMTNPSLSQYLADKQMTIYQKYASSVVSRNTSIQEALILFLESSYGFQTLEQIIYGQLDAEASYVVFQLSNYYTFQDTIEEINQAMIELSIDKIIQFEDNLHYIYYPCMIVSFILIIISFRYYLIILRKYEKVNQNQSYDFGQYLKLEMERIKYLNQFVENDKLNYLDYLFDLYETENRLNLIDHQLQLKNTLLKKNNSNLNKKPFIIKHGAISTLFFLLYLSFQFTNYLQLLIYLRKLQLTVKYYNDMQTLQSSSSSLYISKQLSSQISIQQWSFFGEVQRQKAIIRYNDSVINLKEYIQAQSNLNLNQLLVSNEYIYEYNRFQDTDLCSLIEQPQLVEWFCDSYIGGSLRRGFSTSISAILISFQTQYVEYDEFSFYVITNSSELEGGLILESVIGDLCKTIIKDIKSQTQSLSNRLMIVSISYLTLYIPICIFIIYWMQKKENEYFKIALRIVTLLPQSYLFLDNQIDRELRQMAVQFEL